jgi:hypothetical protein
VTEEPTQETPAGAEIPVPKRKDVFADLRKVAKARPDDEDESDASAGSAEQEQGE